MIAYPLVGNFLTSIIPSQGIEEIPPVFQEEATAYIAAVETALGSALVNQQKNAINSFIVAEKASGRWTSLARLYFPIWADAAANAICMKTLTAGTFAGTINHSIAGSIRGTASGYLNMGASPSALGLATAQGGLGFLSLGGDSGSSSIFFIGCQNSSSQNCMFQFTNIPTLRFNYNNNSGNVIFNGGISNTIGICSAKRNASTRFIYRRTTAGGHVTLASGVTGDNGIIPTVNLFAMALNNNGSPTGYSLSSFGAFWVDTGWDAANDAAFTLNLKTLWETCTGQVLP